MINWVKIALIVFYIAIVSGIVIGAYNYYTSTQRQLKELQLRNEIMASALTEQKKTIENLSISIEKQREINKEVNVAIKKAEIDLDKLQNTLSKHNFKAISSKKTTLLEKRINSGTNDVLRCFEVVTGGTIKPNENNTSCSSLFVN